MTAALESRHVCAALTVLCALALVGPLRPRAARIAWIVLAILAVVHAAFVGLRPDNVRSLNLVHYYLGAKYPFPYASCYRAIDAGLGRPQIELRDLEHPAVMLRTDVREQRAYFIGLLRANGGEVDTSQPLAELRRRVDESGALKREAEQILAETLPAARIASFRDDVQRAVAQDAASGERDITSDYGFNGSPLYAAVRHVDPSLYVPFGLVAAWVNVLWQIAATIAIAWCIGAALELDTNERLACIVLLCASWDTAGWSFAGLIFAGLWLPIALALFAWRRGRPALSGACIAWAGLIKLFPFVLLLPHAVRCARALLRRGESPRNSLRALAGAACATPVLFGVGLLSGRSWLDFWHKISIQFQAGGHVPNDVSASGVLAALGIFESPLHTVLAALMLLVLVSAFAHGDERELDDALPRRSLVLLAATGWLVGTWLNYYAIAPLLLLPLLARTRRWLALAIALALAASCALPEFGDAALAQRPWLQAVKLLPYALVPVVLVALELRPATLTKKLRIAFAAAAAIALLAIAAEAVRWRAIRSYAASADEALDRGDTLSALEDYTRVVELWPSDALARLKQAMAAARVTGRESQAASSFQHAIDLAPDDPKMRKQRGQWLLKTGDVANAATDFEQALALAPCDDELLYELARARLAQHRPDEAKAHLVRALELSPRKRELRNLLDQLH